MLVVHVLVQESTVIGKSCEIPKDVPAVLTLVYLVSPVSLYVCPEVVPTGVPSSADVTGKGFLPRMDPHVPTKVGRPDELSTAHFARIRALRLRDLCLIAVLLRRLVDGSHGGISGRSSSCELVNCHDGSLQQGEVTTDVLQGVHLDLSVDDGGRAVWCSHGS